MTTSPFSPLGSEADRAGDQRRNLESILHAHNGEVEALKLVIAEANEAPRLGPTKTHRTERSALHRNNDKRYTPT